MEISMLSPSYDMKSNVNCLKCFERFFMLQFLTLTKNNKQFKNTSF